MQRESRFPSALYQLLKFFTIKMIYTRRFYRIKVFQQLYGYFKEEKPNLMQHESAMLKLIDKTHELYIYILSYVPEFVHFLEFELDSQRNKYIPNQKIISQIEAFSNNKLLIGIANSDTLKAYIKHYKIKWNDTKEIHKQVWNLTKRIHGFEEYTSDHNHSFLTDKSIFSEWLQHLLVDAELFASNTEDKYINWEDDQTMIADALLKTLDKMKENQIDKAIMTNSLAPEARQFMIDLIRKCVAHDEEYTQIISTKIQNWDVERIAVADMIMMKMALCEMLAFESIPVKVSINEYLELAKLYSTPQSHSFINGILDKVQIDLRKQEKIVKTGRGLVE
jgi:N utilization substance protein B